MKTAHQVKCQEYYNLHKDEIGQKRKQYRIDNLEKLKLRDSLYYEENKELISLKKKSSRNVNLSYRLSSLLGNAKARSKAKNIDFDLSKEFLQSLWIRQQGLCAITKTPLSLEEEKTRWVGSLVSLDRIDSSKGYTMDNVQLVTTSVNYAKGSLSMDEFVTLCRMVVDNA